jgi:hypothetical protein
LATLLLGFDLGDNAHQRRPNRLYFVSDQAEDLFQRLVERFSADPSVAPPGEGKGFGAGGLKVNGKIFAMLSKGELVVKLPRKRVDELVDTGTGTRFDPGHGRVMKEWVSIPPKQASEWTALADEARAFVGA